MPSSKCDQTLTTICTNLYIVTLRLLLVHIRRTLFTALEESEATQQLEAILHVPFIERGSSVAQSAKLVLPIKYSGASLIRTPLFPNFDNPRVIRFSTLPLD